MRWFFRNKNVILAKLLFIFVVSCTFLVMLTPKTESNDFAKIVSSHIKTIVEHSDSTRNNQSQKKHSGPIFARGKCNIPELQIDSPEVYQFFYDPALLECQREFSEDEKNWVYLDEEGIIRFQKSRIDARCSAQFFERNTDNENYYPRFENIRDGDRMRSDFANIRCSNSLWYWLGFADWTGQLMTVVRDEKAAAAAKVKSGNKEKLNVFFLGFDSLSQMTFRRKLPKTVKVLEQVLGSTILNGYNIVGDGTPQAFIPILTGQTELELPLTRRRFSDASYVDDVYPFIWNNYSNSGYVTLFGEDVFQVGTFSYRLKGFRKQPTTHYTRTFFKELEWTGDVDCMGDKPMFEHWFQYSKSFMKVYQDVPKFLLMHQATLSHDDLNKVALQDDYLSAFLRDMYNTGMFDNTLVILMADHGHRFSQLRATHQGQLEERLPFFSFALPEAFKKTERGAVMQKNLEDNKARLTTPFDIHATLLDIVNLPSVEVLNKEQPLTQRSQSIFRKIKDERTCDQAGIETHWCTCLDWQDAKNETRRLKPLVYEIVKVFNKETAPERELCAELEFKEILDAKKLTANKDLLAYKNNKDADGFVPDLDGKTEESFVFYQIKFETVPGNAIYEVTFQYEKNTRTLKLDFASVSHVNEYGDAPHCIIDKNYFLASYCVCRDKVQRVQ